MLSGSDVDASIRNYTGVGFIVSPEAQKAVTGFRAVNDRIAELRIRVPGGTLKVLSCYAPHSKKPYDVRKKFYNDLLSNWKVSTSHTSTMVLGDFNAKLFHRLPGEEDILGSFVFASPFSVDLASSNRELLLEACVAMSAVVGNTFFENSEEHLVTYYVPGTNPKDAINPKGFSHIDFCL